MAQTRKPSKCDEVFAFIKAPKDDFRLSDRYQTPWYPLFCNECDTWHLCAYRLNFGRQKDRRFMEVWAVNAHSNDPEFVDIWNEREGMEKFDKLHSNFFGDRFVLLIKRSWASYYDWVLETSRDPLKIVGKEGTPRRTLEDAYLGLMMGAGLTRQPSVN